MLTTGTSAVPKSLKIEFLMRGPTCVFIRPSNSAGALPLGYGVLGISFSRKGQISSHPKPPSRVQAKSWPFGASLFAFSPLNSFFLLASNDWMEKKKKEIRGMHVLCYDISLCFFHAPFHAFIVEHDVLKCDVESDKTADVMIDVLADIHGEGSASLYNGLDGIIQRTCPSVDVAFDEYKLRVGVKFDEFFDEKLGNFDNGLVISLACIPSYMVEERGTEGQRGVLHRSWRAICRIRLCHMVFLCLNTCNV